MTAQHAADRAGREPNAEFLLFTLNPHAAPAAVLPPKSNYERDQVPVHRWPTGPTLFAPSTPLARGRLPVPAEQRLGSDQEGPPAMPGENVANAARTARSDGRYRTRPPGVQGCAPGVEAPWSRRPCPPLIDGTSTAGRAPGIERDRTTRRSQPMMSFGGATCQLSGQIDILVPFTPLAVPHPRPGHQVHQELRRCVRFDRRRVHPQPDPLASCQRIRGAVGAHRPSRMP